MTWDDWILQCLGVYNNSGYLDQIEKDFGIEYNPTDQDTLELVKYALESAYDTRKCSYGSMHLGDMLAAELYKEVIDRAVRELDADEDDFDWYLNGALDTHLYYKEQEVTCWNDIEKLYRRKRRLRRRKTVKHTKNK